MMSLPTITQRETSHAYFSQLRQIPDHSGRNLHRPASDRRTGAARPLDRGRTRVVKLALDARSDPQTVRAANEAWLEQWINDVPDFMFKPEAVASWCIRSARGEMRKVVRFQYGASALAYQIEHNLPDPQRPPTSVP
ncbi:hypothetical protein LP420_12385 [Massilia sp. B-10]|nr:hypothetical protein LP420_12385 [Massilia sp. B-10]